VRKRRYAMKRSSVSQVKKEKRDRRADVTPGMTRRGFLTYLGVGSAALAAGSTGVLPRTVGARDNFSGAPSTPYRDETAGDFELSFDPIEPTDADKLVLSEGYKFDTIPGGESRSPGIETSGTTTTT
jgi:hypothetical protein